MTAPTETSVVQEELRKDFALPELADTMEEAEARAKASTFLTILKAVEKEKTANDAEYKTLMEYQAEDHKMRQDKLDKQTKWLTETLEGLFGVMDPGKKKSVNLLGGTVGTQAQQDELVIEDDEEFVVWAQKLLFPSLCQIKTVHSPNRKNLRAYMKTKPKSPPPGVSLVKRSPVFYARPK